MTASGYRLGPCLQGNRFKGNKITYDCNNSAWSQTTVYEIVALDTWIKSDCWSETKKLSFLTKIVNSVQMSWYVSNLLLLLQQDDPVFINFYSLMIFSWIKWNFK